MDVLFTHFLGDVAQWLTVLVIVAAAYAVWRGGGGTAIATLETANRVLEARVHELEKLRTADQRTINELQAKTDVAVALVPIVEWTHTHEARAQTRHEATLRVLDLIAQRLGPDG